MILKSILSSTSRLPYAFAFLGLCFAAGSQAANTPPLPAAGIPADIIGTWEVAAVHVDTEATRTPLYRRDDFRLVGRIFQFSSASITSNTPERQDCRSPGVAASLPVAGLIESSMGKRHLPPTTPTAADYGLRLPADPKASAFTLSCNGKLWGASLGPDGGTQGTWLLRLANGALAVRWYDETILELRRIPDNARPKPSFDCGKASTDSERAICSSMALSKLDLSIARAFAAAADEMQGAALQNALATLKKRQRAWLLRRNHCRSDAACLEKMMSDRLEMIEGMLPDH